MAYRPTYKSGSLTKVSRSKIDLFTQCPRCFFLDYTLGVKRPSLPAFSLNNAVDTLLKKEFDRHRSRKEPHPLMTQYGVDAVPFWHEDLEKWRHTFTGVQCIDTKHHLLIYGAVDDVWKDTKTGELIVVDYKATATDGKVTLEGKWKEGYKRQMEVYQWLLRKNDFPVSSRGYFVYVNGQSDREAFDGKLEFDVDLLPYDGNDGWIEGVIENLAACLQSPIIPASGSECEYCAYRDSAGNAFKNHVKANPQK